MKNVTDFYNKTASWSDEYLKERKESEILKKFHKCFVLGGTREPRILDLGCGAGYDAKILKNLGARVVGLDISEKNIEIAKEKVKDCKFFVGDITESMSSLGGFDGVICLATLIHIDIQKMKQTLDNISAVLKKGGLFLFSTHDGAGKDIQKSYVKIEGEDYDRDFNDYSINQICSLAYPNFKLVDSWRFDDFSEGWKYYVFMKN